MGDSQKQSIRQRTKGFERLIIYPMPVYLYRYKDGELAIVWVAGRPIARLLGRAWIGHWWTWVDAYLLGISLAKMRAKLATCK